MSHEARALVVDDDDAIRFMVSKILEREGYLVEQARDGFEAINKLQGADFQLVLLDLMMPRVDGFHVLERIHRENPSLLDRFIVMSALSPDHMRVPIQRVLYKPFDVSHLTQHARELMRRDDDEQIA